MSDPTLHWCATPQDFAPWQEAWQRLRQACKASPYHDAVWLQGSWSLPQNPMAIGIIAREQQIVLAIAFNADPDAGPAVLIPARLLRCMPHISSAHPAGVVALLDESFATDPALSAAVDKILVRAARSLRWDAWFLDYLGPELRWFTDAVHRVAAARGWHVREGVSSPEAYINITGGFEAFLATRSKDFRKKQRRWKRNLEELGGWDLRELAASEMPWAELEAQLLAAFSVCWQQDSIHSPLHPKFRPTLLATLSKMRTAGMLRVYIASFKGKPVAFEFGLVDSSCYYPQVRGYDREVADISPGNQIAEFTIDNNAKDGRTLLYLGPIETSAETLYKRHWLTEERTISNLFIVPRYSTYGIIDLLYRRSTWFQRLWWKFDFGKKAKARYIAKYGPTG